MRKRLLLLLLAVGLSGGGSIRAQPPAKTSSPGDDSNDKPCVVVVGAVKSPARFELRGRLRLAEALVGAGGLTYRAASIIEIVKSGTNCFRTSPGDQIRKSALSSAPRAVFDIADLSRNDQKSNPYLKAGDVVIVNELDPIYVVGSVVNPGAIYPKEPLTLTQAIRLAGPVTSDPMTSKVMIFRQTKDSTGNISIAVDLQAIRKQSAEDPILHAHDIVYVGATGRLRGTSNPMFDTRPLIPRARRVIY